MEGWGVPEHERNWGKRHKRMKREKEVQWQETREQIAMQKFKVVA